MKSIRDSFERSADEAERATRRAEAGCLDAFLDAVEHINADGFLRVAVDMNLGGVDEIPEERCFNITVMHQFEDLRATIEMDFEELYARFCNHCGSDRAVAAALFVDDIAAQAGAALARVRVHKGLAARLGGLRPPTGQG